jgi:hypothetical protein
MSKFEFIAVLLSIIFGLGLTNLLTGMLQAFLRRELTDTRIAWSILIGNILLLDWWIFFRWSDHVDWRFHEFVYLTIWATVHYMMAASLYPFKLLTEYSEELQRKFVLGSVLVMSTMDIGENYIRGSILDPWYYLPWMFYVMAWTALPLLVSKPWAMRVSGWVLAMSVFIWSVVVRSFLVT